VHSPTGEQFELIREGESGTVRATITGLAAGLRQLSVDGIDITEPFAEDVIPPFGNGIVLVPWPNRIRDALWTLNGEPQQLDITEPERNNALHGLLRYTPYTAVERDESSITLAATVYPQHGYPFHLDTTVRYQLEDDGLTVTHGFRNLSRSDAPVAVGTHPFFTIGDVPTDDLVLTLNASTVVEVDDRLNATGESPVDGTEFDLRSGRRVADLSLDTAFGGVEMTDGVGRHWLQAADGRRVELWQDESCGWVQVFTTRKFPKKGALGLAIAIEPMTAPPDAFNSGDGVRWLRPDEQWSVSWGVRYSR
jgi:aldose 1-epimerase